MSTTTIATFPLEQLSGAGGQGGPERGQGRAAAAQPASRAPAAAQARVQAACEPGPATAPAASQPAARAPRVPLVDESVPRALTARAQAALRGAALVIDSDALLALAGEDLRAVKALQHEVEAQRTAITGPLNEALRRVNELFRAPRRYLEEAESALKRAMVT